MAKASNAQAWIEEGYLLFANEGLEGIQVERLARILQFNKSGFYHHFGDMEGFCAELITLHEGKVHEFLGRIRELKKLDPDYLQLLIDRSPTVMFQVQLTRHKTHVQFYELSKQVDRLVDAAIYQLWCDFLDIENSGDVVMRYYALIRDMFYTRISFDNLNYSFLHNLVSEAKGLVHELAKKDALAKH